jgi:hypothetical protein
LRIFAANNGGIQRKDVSRKSEPVALDGADGVVSGEAGRTRER